MREASFASDIRGEPCFSFANDSVAVTSEILIRPTLANTGMRHVTIGRQMTVFGRLEPMIYWANHILLFPSIQNS